MNELNALQKVLLVTVGSALGGNARYWLGSWIQSRYGSDFPIGTLVINLSGAFLLGMFLSIAAERYGATGAPAGHLLIAVGFLGAYTTFSTFEYDNLRLLQSGAVGAALLNIVGSLLAGLLAVWMGSLAGRQL